MLFNESECNVRMIQSECFLQECKKMGPAQKSASFIALQKLVRGISARCHNIENLEKD